MQRSYLIQRLHAPIVSTGPLADLVNAFSFGGGYVNGGLTKEAMALLKNICSFDYMGAALPKTIFEQIHDHRNSTPTRSRS